MPRLTAYELLDVVLDDDSFESWDEPIDTSPYEPRYREEVAQASVKAGVDESVITGRGRIDGLPVALLVGEFRFLGGSIGIATARRIVAAVQRATAERLPLIAATASGGTRMQEGTPAFVEMVTITRAIVEHKKAGLPYLVYLRHPTTGGVFASWGSLGHVTVAEPGALIGFLGPKVYESLHGQKFPQGVQVAENLVDHGVIDAVVPTDELASVASRVLRLLHQPDVRPTSIPADTSQGLRTPPRDAWESVQLTRTATRPGVRELLKYGADDVIPLSGTGEGQHDAGLMLALTSFGGEDCVLVGQDRRNQAQASMGPAALREARRGFRLAQELNIPLVSVIDTPGADLSANAEEGALAGEIARSIAEMTQLTVPSVALLLGQGCGGGALAMLPAQRVLVAENGWLSPLPPEGASVISYGTTEHAADMTRQQKVSAHDLLAAGIAHRIVPEPADGQVHEFVRLMAEATADELRQARR